MPYIPFIVYARKSVHKNSIQASEEKQSAWSSSDL